MRIFVTGAAGFIGAALARRLAGEGHDVTGLVRRGSAPPSLPGVRLVEGDLGEEQGLDRAREHVSVCDAVVHAAAIRKDWGISAERLRRVNVESGPALVDLAGRATRFVFVSSVAVYAASRDGAPTREESPFGPRKRYGWSKLEAEGAIREAATRRRVPLTIVRPGITYGPGDTYGMVANLARLVARRRFLMVGSGESRVNLLYVDDLAQGLARALVEPRMAGEDVILAGSDAVPVARLVAAIAGEVGRSVPRLHVPEWSARLLARGMEAAQRALRREAEPFLTRAKIDLFTRDDLYDASKARALLGFEPGVGLEEGARHAVLWLRRAGQLP